MEENKLIQKIFNTRLLKWLYENPAPRWIVLCADISVVIVFSFLTIFITSRYATAFPSPLYQTLVKVSVIIAAYFLSSMIVGSYKYVIRLSVVEDIYKLAMMVSLASATLIAIEFVARSVSHHPYFAFWNIFVIASTSFMAMVIARLSVKWLYALFSSANSPRIPVIVLGSALNSYMFANALKNEAQGRFNPVAMLSLDDNKSETSINGIPIYSFDSDKIAEIFEQNNCDTLLFLSAQIDEMREGIADIFLQNNIHLLMLNQVEEFDTTENNMPDLSSHVKNIQVEDLLGRPPIKNHNPQIMRLIKDEVVMITGAAGSIGSEIVRQVASFHAKDIVLIDQAETPMHDLQLELNESFPGLNFHLFVGDVTNKRRMEKAFNEYHPKYVFHAAAYKHVPMMEINPSEAALTNIFGTKNIADLSVKYGVEKFVMISTDKAVNPTNVMGATKRIAEIYVQSLFFKLSRDSKNASTRFITTRFGNVLGSNGSVIPLFRKQIASGGPVTVTHKDIIRYFMTIPEACSLVLEAGCMGDGGEIYIFDMGNPVKIYDLACRMITLAGLKVGRDIQIVESGLRPGEKLYEELLNNKEQTIATSHKKIMISKVPVYKYDNIINGINAIGAAIEENDNHLVVLEMKHLVPEYKSQNSRWQELDKEVESESQYNNQYY